MLHAAARQSRSIECGLSARNRRHVQTIAIDKLSASPSDECMLSASRSGRWREMTCSHRTPATTLRCTNAHPCLPSLKPRRQKHAAQLACEMNDRQFKHAQTHRTCQGQHERARLERASAGQVMNNDLRRITPCMQGQRGAQSRNLWNAVCLVPPTLQP